MARSMGKDALKMLSGGNKCMGYNPNQAYAVQLQLKEENGAWKITSFDTI